MSNATQESQAAQDPFGYCAELVQKRHYDHFVCALLAPKAYRRALFTIYAFAAELAHIHNAVSEPMLGEIRLQWWRDAVDEVCGASAVRAHPVTQAMKHIHHSTPMDKALMLNLIDAHTADIYPDPVADVEAYAKAIGGGIAALTAQQLGGDVAAAMQYGTQTALYFIAPEKINAPFKRLPKSKADRQAVLPIVLASQHAKRVRKGKIVPAPSFAKQIALYTALLTGRV